MSTKLSQFAKDHLIKKISFVKNSEKPDVRMLAYGKKEDGSQIRFFCSSEIDLDKPLYVTEDGAYDELWIGNGVHETVKEIDFELDTVEEVATAGSVPEVVA